MSKPQILLVLALATVNCCGYAKDLSAFKLKNFKSRNVKQDVNLTIDKAIAKRHCDNQNKHSYWQTQTKQAYKSSLIYSLLINDNYYCGGPYPNNINSSLNFDLRTGKQIQFHTLFINYKQNKQQIMQDFISNNPLDVASDCKVYTADYLLEQGFSFYFTDTGITILPHFPHVIAACERPLNLSYKKLMPHASPAGIIAQLYRQHQDQ